MEISRGTAGDRPWAELFAELAFWPEPVELTIETGAQFHKVAFAHEAVVWASSPLAADSALRVALAYGVITTAMMPAVATRVATTPSADPIEVLAAVAQLSPETTLLLRRRTIAVAATRVFGLTSGTYRVTRGLTSPVKDGTAIDVRALVYEGMRTHAAEQQLAGAIAPFGTSFRLRPEADEDVSQFGFSATDMPVVEELRTGASLDDLVARHPDLGQRGVLAIINALLAMHALDPEGDEAPSRASHDTEPPLDLGEPALDLADGLPRTTMVQAAVAWPLDVPAEEALDFADDGPAATTAVQGPLDLSDDSFGNTTAPQAPLDLSDERLGGFDIDDEQPVLTTERPTRNITSHAAFEAARARPTQTTELELEGERSSRSTIPQIPQTFDLVEEHPATVDDPLLSEPPAATEPPAKFTTQPPTTGTFGTRTRPTVPPFLPELPKEPPKPALETRNPARPTQSTTLPGAPPRAHPALDAPRAAAPRPHPALEQAPRPHPALEARAPKSPTQLPALAPLKPLTGLARPTLPPRPAATPVRTPARATQPPAKPAEPAPRPAIPNPPIPPLATPGAPATLPDTAAQHFERGVGLINRDMERAVVELRTAARLSGDVDHLAVLAWAQFCLAPNKEVAAKPTKAALAKAIYQSAKPEIAHFYLGRLERMLGRDREALEYFKTVVDLVPKHTEALAEIRTLEARLKKR